MYDSVVTLERLPGHASVHAHADHPRRLGIRLRSTASVAVPHGRSPTSELCRQMLQRQSTSAMTEHSRARNVSRFIQNIVVPLQLSVNERRKVAVKSRTGSAAPSESTRPRPKAISSAHRSLYSVKTSSTNLDQYMSSETTNETRQRRRHGNTSRQAARFEKEQTELAQTRFLRRASEIRDHRVDRLYYMCGRSLNMQNRYEVDEDELRQLRKLAASQQESMDYSRRQRYGSVTNKYISEKAIAIPLKPPPSAMSNLETVSCVTPLPPEDNVGTVDSTSCHKVAPAVDETDAGVASQSVDVGTLKTSSLAGQAGQGAPCSEPRAGSEVKGAASLNNGAWPDDVAATDKTHTQTFLTENVNSAPEEGTEKDDSVPAKGVVLEVAMHDISINN